MLLTQFQLCLSRLVHPRSINLSHLHLFLHLLDQYFFKFQTSVLFLDIVTYSRLCCAGHCIWGWNSPRHLEMFFCGLIVVLLHSALPHYIDMWYSAFSFVCCEFLTTLSTVIGSLIHTQFLDVVDSWSVLNTLLAGLLLPMWVLGPTGVFLRGVSNSNNNSFTNQFIFETLKSQCASG